MKQSRVDAVQRQHFRARGDVGRGETQLFAAPLARHHSPGNEMIAPEERSDPIDMSLADELPNAGAAHPDSAD